MTNVKFLIEKPEGDLPCNVIAFFPDEYYYSRENIGYGGVTADNWKDMRTSYAHLGQHSGCHIDYANECKEAVFGQYNDLLRELIGQGYNDLHILNSQLKECHRQPTGSEVKFGEGATHYRKFTVGEMGITKEGDLKRWFVADDGLRYYTR